MPINIKNPKNSYKDIPDLYNYYAGFSASFVSEILSNQEIDNINILDPWNGSGTTTKVAYEYGVNKIYGFDINPVMSIIASGKLISSETELCLELKKNRYLRNSDVKNDPLEQWFTRTSIKNIRNTELEIRNKVLGSGEVDKNNYLAIDSNIYKEISNNHLLSYYYIVIFEVIKKLAEKFKTSNPTWIKVAKNPDEKIKITQNEFQTEFLRELNKKNKLVDVDNKLPKRDIYLDIADSRDLPLENNSIDLVITSPPYCTRIDYAVATRLELAILGMSDEFELLRKSMIGTTKITGNLSAGKLSISETAENFLNAVYTHHSKASKTYYYKQFTQYFEGIIHSISELSRVIKINGTAVIVVQDSYYKDIHLDIATIFIEIFQKFSWKLLHKKNFEKKQTMVSMNKNTKSYRRISNPIETVLIFERMK